MLSDDMADYVLYSSYNDKGWKDTQYPLMWIKGLVTNRRYDRYKSIIDGLNQYEINYIVSYDEDEFELGPAFSTRKVLVIISVDSENEALMNLLVEHGMRKITYEL